MRKTFQNVTFQLTVFLLVTTFLLFLSSGWLIFQWFKLSKEKDLGDRLIGIGKVIAKIFKEKDIFVLDVGLIKSLKNSPTVNDLNSTLSKVRIENKLRSILVLNKAGEVLIDPGKRYETGEWVEKIRIDGDAWEKALVGIPSVSEYYEVKDNPNKRAYVPIRDQNGRVEAIIRIEASRYYFQSFFFLSRFLMWIGVIISLVLLLIVLRVNRMVRNLLKVEEAMSIADRFHALGTLTAGFAHEMRNPLGIIRTTTEVLNSELTDEDKKNLTKDILEEVDRMNSLLKQFLNFANPNPLEIDGKSVRLRSVLDSLIPLIQKGIKNNDLRLKIKISLPEDDPIEVAGEEKGLRQILINLLLNAQEAMQGKKGEVWLNVDSKRDKVIIEIKDEGCGISEDNLKRIFDPFFTTKTDGTGLGLSVSRKIIESFGGNLEINSKEGLGTTAKIILNKRM